MVPKGATRTHFMRYGSIMMIISVLKNKLKELPKA